jgi:hypothetical protein
VVRDTDTPECSDTDLHASHLCNDDDTPFAIGVQIPDCHWEYVLDPQDENHWCVWFLDPGSRS